MRHARRQPLLLGRPHGVSALAYLASITGLLLLIAAACGPLAAQSEQPTAPTQAAMAQLDMNTDGQSASRVVAILSEVTEREVRLANELLDAGLADQQMLVSLRGADISQSLQAIAHSLDCWWHSSGERLILNRQSHLVSDHLSRVQTYSTNLHDLWHLEDIVLRFMHPWLGQDHGIAYHAPLGRWSATLNNHGHRRFQELLSAIERPQVALPALLALPRVTTAQHLFPEDRQVRSWRELFTVLAPHCSALAVHTRNSFPDAITLRAGPFDSIPLQLSAQHIPSAIVSGVLCIGGAPKPREHPGSRARLVAIPVHQLGGEANAAALIAGWCRPERHSWWAEPGAAYLHVRQAGLLVAQVDRQALAALLADIERFELREARP